jgi:hypothetical protein
LSAFAHEAAFRGKAEALGSIQLAAIDRRHNLRQELSYDDGRAENDPAVGAKRAELYSG